MPRGAFIGIDIGGRSIKGIRLEAGGEIARRSRRATPADEGARAVLATVSDLVAELAEGGRVSAVGVGTPGGIDGEGRAVGEAANIPGWKGARLGAEAARAAGAPAYARNDGNMAAYAEWAARGGRSRATLYVGLGTGIGGGFIEDGRIIGGVDDKGLEIGHAIVYPEGRPCACGRSGCAEAYASGPSIGRLASEMADRFDTPLSREAGAARAAGTGRPLEAREVYEALAAGDELAKAVHALAAEALARAIGQALAFLAPDTVVIGGGLLAGATTLVEDLARAVPGYVYASASEGVRFEPALLGAEAGAIGAALYAASRALGEGESLRLASLARIPKAV